MYMPPINMYVYLIKVLSYGGWEVQLVWKL